MITLLLKKINLSKIKNIVLLKLSYWYSRIVKEPHVWGSPFAVAIEPLNYCNLACPECFAGNGALTREKKILDVPGFMKIINQLSSNVTYLTLYFQGEPLLHPQFYELVQIAHKKGIFTSTSTNGHFLTNRDKNIQLIRSGLDRLIISIDGTTQEVYEKYRKNGDLSKVLQGIKSLIEVRKELNSSTPYVEIQFLVMKHNEHQIKEIKELTHLLGADKLALKSVQVYDYENDEELIPENPKYSRYVKKDNKYRIKGKLKNCCWRQWSSVVITCTGDVIPCCFDKNADYPFGNLFDQPFKEIWNNKRINMFRKKILTNRKSIEMCNNCTEM